MIVIFSVLLGLHHLDYFIIVLCKESNNIFYYLEKSTLMSCINMAFKNVEM